MLAPQRFRLLNLAPSGHPRGQPHISSASGLVRVGRWLYIVADDEHHLGQLDARDILASRVLMVRFARTDLPADAAQRKRTKPDLETLIHIPATAPAGNSLLVALGSASHPRRERAFVFTLDSHGERADGPRELSLGELIRPLREQFGELNLEAGFVQGERMHLFQRANAGQPLNGHITYETTAIRAWLAGSATDPPPPLTLETLDLGSIDGVPLGITDAAAWPDGGWIFCAVAEDTSDAYSDGACVGSVIGWVDDQNRVRRIERLQGPPKVEGLALAGDGRIWLVTDADDPQRPSELLEVLWMP
jgi:hypothetical protein